MNYKGTDEDMKLLYHIVKQKDSHQAERSSVNRSLSNFNIISGFSRSCHLNTVALREDPI